MFSLTEMQDTVRLPPWKFNTNIKTSLVEEIDKKLANKVVINVGLCMNFYDMLEIGDSYILPGDGSAFTKVRFRYVVFRPFFGEIIQGKIKSSSQEGIHVSLEFFDDILIPPHGLQNPYRFNEATQVWIWDYDGNELSMDKDEEIRFRVIDETFVDTSPTEPSSKEANETEVDRKVPYTIKGTINEPGLGLLAWW